MLQTFLSFFIVFLIIYGIEGFGVVPESLLVRVNDNFTVSCFVDYENGRLDFYDDNELVPENFIKRANNTHIEMTRSYSKPIKKNFTCKQNRHSIAPSEIWIDDVVPSVQDFKCRTKNLTTLLCSLTKPKTIAGVKYRLKFSINGDRQFHKSPLTANGRGGHSSVIALSESNTDTFFTFILNSTNFVNSIQQKFEIKLMETLTPCKVEQLESVNNLTTHNSAIISFSLPKELERVSHEMLFDVRLSDDITEVFDLIENPQLQVVAGKGLLALNDLNFSNVEYTVKIRMKSKIARNDDEMWSPFASVSFKTKPKVPDVMPKTCRNCFNVMDNGNVVAYWMAVPRQFQSGENFKYFVRGFDEIGDETFSIHQTETFIILKDESLSIEILSVNNLGSSKQSSKLRIPNENSKKLLKIRKELIGSEYKISWKSLTPLDVESYTVVTCNQRNDLANQCDGSITFYNVSKHINEFTLEASVSKQFGVAANLMDETQLNGFEWAECTASQHNEIGQVHSLWRSAVSDNSITIQWKLNCVDEPITVGYNITYCVVADEDGMDECVEELQHESVIPENGGEMHQYEIQHLKSYRLYRVSIALLSNFRHGLFKAPIIVRTLESAPTAPRNLKAINIEQHEITFTWNRPVEVNGESMTYQFWYNDQKLNINDNETMNETFTFKLQDLEAFTDYTITVVACTSDCSEASQSLTIKTRTGAPGKMYQPKLEKKEENFFITWEMPSVAGGNLDFLQLKMKQSKNDESKVYRIDGRARSCVIHGLSCEMEKIDFFIRSVNVEFDEEKSENIFNSTPDCFASEISDVDKNGHFYGNWSQPMNFVCQINLSISMIGSIFLLTLSLLISVYMFIRLYHKYKEMKDIGIVWPKGLDPESPASSPAKSSDGVKDLDLLRDHTLTDIEEEEDERQKFIQPPAPDQRESGKSDVFLPFLVNPKTNEISYTLPKLEANKVKSLPVSPERVANNYLKFSSTSQVNNAPTGYMKMYAPQRSTSESIMSTVEGYLDMSGKSPTTPTKPVESNYLRNDIKQFIKESELNNNGYIGKRSSILSDSTKKHSTIVNSNGYVGLQRN